jgi:S1-C subfamily serine protease
MRLQDELYLIQMAEAEASGQLTPAQRAELDSRLAEDAAFAQSYKEYFDTISNLQENARRKNYKALLQDVHAEVVAPRQKRGITLHIQPKHLRTAGIAASVALLTTMASVWMLRPGEPRNQMNNNLQLVRHEMEKLKVTQQQQQKQIAEIRENADVVTAAPPSNYTGTGFALSNDGYLITNYHVVDGAEDIRVLTRSGQQLQARVVAYEPKNDIALLKITDKNFKFGKGELPYSFLAGKAGLGSAIFTLGFPQDEIVYNEGYIASRNGFEGDTNQYRLEVPAGPGQSGAPVVDGTGTIIGIIRSKDEETESTTYAVASRTLLRLLRDVPKDRRPKLPQANKLGHLSRTQLIDKLQDYTCMIQVYKK